MGRWGKGKGGGGCGAVYVGNPPKGGGVPSTTWDPITLPPGGGIGPLTHGWTRLCKRNANMYKG